MATLGQPIEKRATSEPYDEGDARTSPASR
jgi:hypothetical protein